FLAELLGHFETGLDIVLEEVEKIFALDEIDLAGIERLGRHFVRFARNRGAQAEHLAGLGKLHNDGSAAGRVDRELDAAFAKHEDTAGHLPFDKQHGSLGIGGCVLDVFKCPERGIGQIAEDTIGAQLARDAAFYNLHSVWREHEPASWTTRLRTLLGGWLRAPSTRELSRTSSASVRRSGTLRCAARHTAM